jgi:hypothetical protein
MKAQRRHELQQNVLGAELNRGLEFVKERRTPLVWGVVLLVLAVFVVWHTVSKARATQRDLQTTYDRLTGTPSLPAQEFLDGMKSLSESSNKPIAALATVQVAKFYLSRFSAAGGMVADPQQKALADQASAYFRRAIQKFGDQRSIVAESHLGLARLAESIGDFAAAANEYQAVTGMMDLAGTPVGVEAMTALAKLDRIKTPVRMATTSSAPSATAPAKAPTLAPAQSRR